MMVMVVMNSLLHHSFPTIRAYLRSKKYREALEDLSSAINLDPNDKTKILQRTK